MMFNCENCPKKHTDDCPIDYEKINGNSDVFEGMRRVRDNCLMGCHPGVREYLMKDVIKELKSERERMLFTQDELCSLFLIVDSYMERTNDKRQETMELIDKIQSLRIEP